VLVGLVLWVFVLKSGVHATLAGVALALAIPLRAKPGEASSLVRIEHELAPWVGFGVLPLFGFANAGLSFADLSLSSIVEPIPLGIAAGLFLGKQIGVFGAAAAVIRRGWARLPDGAVWATLWGTSILTGIGFTMSLFIGTLAFGESDREAPMRLGVLVGSALRLALSKGEGRRVHSWNAKTCGPSRRRAHLRCSWRHRVRPRRRPYRTPRLRHNAWTTPHSSIPSCRRPLIFPQGLRRRFSPRA
jgi:NhaA family Na+:H+ antiporter